jgi:hypothetical protein
MNSYRILIIGWLSFASFTETAIADSLKPVLSLTLTLKLPAATGNLASDRDLMQSKEARKKALTDFKDALAKLNKPNGESAKHIATLRQSANKLGPGAKLLAELTAARVIGGITSSGVKSGKPSPNYRRFLLAAGNIAARIDEPTHEQTALYALALWRKIEGAEAPWTSAPVDTRAQKKFTFFRAVIERQALYEWQKDQREPALKKYRALAVAFNASADGAAIDVRLIELEKMIYKQTKQTRRWQRSLIDTGNKYQDPQFLGVGQEAKTQRVTATVAALHRELINSLIKDALPKQSQPEDRKKALDAIDLYLTTNIDGPEKERVRASQGEIEYNAGNHKAAAGVFAALATESVGAKSMGYWRKAIRSQLNLANWPADAPWKNLPKGDAEPREVLIDMFRKVDGKQMNDWPTTAHIGLLMIANHRIDEAYALWTERLNLFPKGVNAANAVGWMVAARVSAKQWTEVESLGRLMVKAALSGQYQGKSFKPKDILGLGLLEGGLASLAAGDFKTSIAKLEEYVKGWRGDQRHDEGMYHLALAHQGDRQFRAAVQSLENFTKAYPKSKWRHEALVNGGAWTIALTWDEHVIYFLETHAKEFPTAEKSKDSLLNLADLYLGREIYDSALRVMSILLTRSDVDTGVKNDIARRLLDTAERHASSEKAMKTADKILVAFKDDQTLKAYAYSLKARLLAAKGNIKAVSALANQMTSLDQSSPNTIDLVSEVNFLLAESMSKNQFKEEVFSLGSKDPKGELESGYQKFNTIYQAYKASCATARTSWCGPALHRAARVAEAFVKAYDDLSIAKTLEPATIKDFYARKKEILESVDAIALESDEKSAEQARLGATNPDWTAAIMWQNGGQWSQDKFSGEDASHFIQWHTR